MMQSTWVVVLGIDEPRTARIQELYRGEGDVDEFDALLEDVLGTKGPEPRDGTR